MMQNPKLVLCDDLEGWDGEGGGKVVWEEGMYVLQPCIPGNKLTQKDNADSGVQFITPAGPRQSFLLAKDPDQFL